VEAPPASWFRRARNLPADGNGVFGAARLKPGEYRVWVDGRPGGRATVRVEPGRVAVVRLAASS
jgi:hypothetical protein